MKTSLRWNEVVRIRGRYQRSVNVERDFGKHAALEGYVVTRLVQGVVARISDGLADGGTRAWSITGPYGAGKSALALFLTELFAGKGRGEGLTARRLLKEQNPALAERLSNTRGVSGPRQQLYPVLATGERRPLEETLVLALQRAVRSFWSGPGVKPRVARDIAALAHRLSAGQRVSPREVTDVFASVAERIAASRNRGTGLLVVLDEAGKALEFAAQEPDRADVHLLQELAELANRSERHPIVFVTLLHQSFEQYATRLSGAQRREWSKVQGRFEDIAFQESATEVVGLVAMAVERRRQLPTGGWTHGERLAVAASKLASTTVFPDRKALRERLSKSLPLHPVTTLVLAPLFRSELAQNERSLFAFLSSGEPHGFQEFLSEAGPTPPESSLYMIDRLYDYVVSAYAGRLAGHQGRQLAAVEEAIRRLPADADAMDARVLKAIGLLTMLGDTTGLIPSTNILSLALDTRDKANGRVERSLGLLQSRSLVVYRKYRNAYQIWEGSDLDLDALARQAARQIDNQTGVAARLNRVLQPRPIVARRHLLRTGTLRYFTVAYLGEDELGETPRITDTGADGSVWIVVARDSHSAAAVKKRLAATLRAPETDRARPVLLGVISRPERLLDVARDVFALERVEAHTPELQTDRVARRELSARTAEAERRLRLEAERLISDQDACTWLDGGSVVGVRHPADLTRVVSEICDRVFCKAPVLQNELLNRRGLSSAGAAARRNLIKAMIEAGDRERLGVEGFPPEYAMYRSMLLEGSLHQQSPDGRWHFGPPPEGAGSFRPAWQAIESALSSVEGRKLTLAAIYGILRDPPYGLKDGPLPVLLMVFLATFDAEMALYEDGSFVPQLTIQVVERLLRSPERFEVQRYRIQGSRSVFLDRVADSIMKGASNELIPVVRQLVKFVNQLPDFSRNTRMLPATAQAVREALLRAREPATLVFRELPRAVGVPSLETDGSPGDAVEVLVDRLRESLKALQGAYTGLLSALEAQLAQTFGVIGLSGERLRENVASRSQTLIPLAIDLEIRSFFGRVADTALGHEQWLASVATVIAGKPPEYWHDGDLDRARVTLSLLGQKRQALEGLAVGIASPGDAPGPVKLIRISFLEKGKPEQTRVLALDASGRSKAEQLSKQILGVLGSIGREGADADRVIGALGLVLEQLLVQLEGDSDNADDGERGVDA